jgi:uncharacterized membrane protein
MLHQWIIQMEVGETLLEWIEYAALAIEVLAVFVILVSIFYAVFHFSFRKFLQHDSEELYRALKIRLGRSLMLGLEILVAADVVRTVALEATLESVAVLGLLVLIRTFLSWSLVVEVEGRWPWQGEQNGNG